jgi:hypothetical protein
MTAMVAAMAAKVARPVRGGVDEERKEGHVEDDGLGVEQGDEKRLAGVVAGLDADGCALPGLAKTSFRPIQAR